MMQALAILGYSRCSSKYYSKASCVNHGVLKRVLSFCFLCCTRVYWQQDCYLATTLLPQNSVSRSSFRGGTPVRGCLRNNVIWIVSLRSSRQRNIIPLHVVVNIVGWRLSTIGTSRDGSIPLLRSSPTIWRRSVSITWRRRGWTVVTHQSRVRHASREASRAASAIATIGSAA